MAKEPAQRIDLTRLVAGASMPMTLVDALDRIAELEARNAVLRKEVAEMQFLVDASALLGATLDESQVQSATLEAASSATEGAAARSFIILRDNATIAVGATRGIESAVAARLVAEHRSAVERSLHTGDPVFLPPDAEAIPIPAGPREPAFGALLLLSKGVLRDVHVARLTQLAGLTGKCLTNARLFAKSIVAGVTDELTGVFNRRYLDRRLGEELRRARRLDERLGLVLLDLDHFKSVNDEHGHQEGDRLLCSVAQAIVTCVRDIDLVTRWGGEEFAVIVPGADSTQAVVVAERIRTAVETLTLQTADGGTLRVTMSCGVAWAAPHIHTPAQFIAAADRCLLEAKRLGRNRTIAMQSGL
ncbi:MAG TPA: GGDEF domain-containing protein [Candidatus Eremiobacteraceae bacterium]|nr:GGDEF domain-containing protein [Candidatus Eremiobacteraceae bacterium]